MKTINQSLMLSSFPVWMASFLLPIYCTGLGLTPLETTGMFSVCSLFILLSKWVSGRWCDRIGRKTVFLLGVFLMALSYLLLGFAQGMWLLYLSQMVDGVATALLSVSLYAMVADRDKEMAVERGKQSAAQNRGGLIGLILYFVLLSRTDFLQSWKLFFLISAAAALAAVWMAKTKLPKDEGNAEEEKVPLRKLLTTKVTHLIAVRFCFSLALNVLGAVFVLVMMQRFESNMTEIGLICLVPSCLLTWWTPSIGAAVKKFGEKRSFFASSVLALVFLIWMAQSGTTLWFGLGWSGYSFAVCAMGLSFDAIFSFEIQDAARGAMSGLYSCSINAGSMIASALGGFLLQTLGVQAPFYATAALLLLTLAVFAAPINRIRRRNTV